jgi:histidinol-phosphate aminotransferase
MAKSNRRELLKSMAAFSTGIGLGAGGVYSFLNSGTPADATVDPQPGDVVNSMAPLRARLMGNENPFGPSSKAKAAMKAAVDKSFQYSGVWRQLRINIGEHEKVGIENILLGAGSSSTILAIAMLYTIDGGEIIAADPTYMDLLDRCISYDAHWTSVPLASDFAHDLEKMGSVISDLTKLIYICNPNNPTGTITSPDKLYDFCKTYNDPDRPIVVDEAYIHYTGNEEKNSMVRCVREGLNVIVLKTFSKIYAGAGWRIGYAISQTKVIDELKIVLQFSKAGPPQLDCPRVLFQ